MSSNALKKMIIFSSEKSKAFFEGAINDEALHNHQSFSGTIEKTLSERYVPSNETAAGILFDLYENVISITDAAANFLNYIGSGGIERVNPEAVKDLIEFCRNQVFSVPTPNTDNPNPRLVFLLTGIEECLTAAKKENTYTLDLNFEIRSVKRIRDIAKNHIDDLYIADIYSIVNECWDILQNVNTTYRLIAEVIKLHDWNKADSFVFAEILRAM